MPINWAELPMQAIGLLAGLVFVASLIGNSLTRNAFVGAILTVIIFVAVYIAWAMQISISRWRRPSSMVICASISVSNARSSQTGASASGRRQSWLWQEPWLA